MLNRTLHLKGWQKPNEDDRNMAKTLSVQTKQPPKLEPLPEPRTYDLEGLSIDLLRRPTCITQMKRTEYQGFFKTRLRNRLDLSRDYSIYNKA